MLRRLYYSSKQEVVGSNTARAASEVFFHRHSESTEYTVLYTRRCRAKLNQFSLKEIQISNEKNILKT